MAREQSAATFAFVTGHEFGAATFRAILSAPEFGEALSCSLLACLDPSKLPATVGYHDLGPFARERGVPVEYIRSIKSEDARRLLTEAAPDYLLIIGWSELAPAGVLDIPRLKHRGTERHTAQYACIGMHQTLLPEGRGRAPIPWTIIKNLKRTGVTTFLLEAAADAGGIVDQIEYPVDSAETATTLFAKAREAHVDLGRRLAAKMAARNVTWRAQDERLASVWPRRRPEDGKIDFSMTSAEVHRFVRALTAPYPGAFFIWKEARVLVHRVELVPVKHSQVPGTILASSPALVVAVGDGAVRIDDCEPPASPLVAGAVLR